MEMVAVTGIIVVLTSVILVNNAKFGGSITLQNVTYDIALSMRQAQTYGIAVRKFGPGAGSFGAGYGMHFEMTSPNGYVMFADAVSSNGLYDAGESVELFTLNGGYHLQDLCATPTSGPEVCGLQQLDILYKRPDPDAYIRGNNFAQLHQRGRITVESPRGDRLHVIVELTGQISVSRTP